MRRAAHIDANQREVVKALRAAGATVQPLAAVGKGCPDLLVGYGGENFLFEVKNPAGLNGYVSRGKGLTADQVDWHARWMGQVSVVSTAEEALRRIGFPQRAAPTEGRDAG